MGDTILPPTSYIPGASKEEAPGMGLVNREKFTFLEMDISKIDILNHL